MHSEDRYHHEYRVSGGRFWYGMTAYVAVSVAGVLRLAARGVPAVIMIPVGVVLVAVSVLFIVSARVSATIVDESLVTIHGPFGSHSRAWPDVQGIEIEMNPGTGARGAPRQRVALYDAAGKRYFLPHLHDRAGLDLAREVAVLREVWILGRGEDWVPVPRIAARIAETRRHPTPLSTVALLTAIGVFVVATMLFVILLLTGTYDGNHGGVATVLSPFLLMLGVPTVVYIATLLIVAARRRADRH
jgi:hypothetical protein